MTAAWQEMRLSDCCEFISDGDHQAPPKADTGVPFITISNISNNRLDFTNTAFVPESYYNALDYKRRAQTGDILYSVVGSFGIPVLIRQALKFTFQRHIAILRPNKHTVPAFLYYLMLSSAFYQQADTVAIGAAQRTISLTALRNMTVKIPSLAIQQKIASILSAYDDLIDNNQQQIKLLEESGSLLYKQLLDTHKCQNKALGDLANIIMGQSPSSDNFNTDEQGIPFHQGVGSFGERFAKTKTFTRNYTKSANAGSILFSVRAPVGRINIIKEFVAIGRGIAAINHKNNHQCWLFYALKRYFFKEDIIGNGAIFNSINRQELQKILLPTPKEEAINTFELLVQKIDSVISSLDQQNLLLKEARDRLLPKLLSGEIEV